MPWEQTTLSYDGPLLDLRLPTLSNRLLVSAQPSADGTIVLHYFPGQLSVAGFKADAFIEPKLSDFYLDGQNHLAIKGLEDVRRERQNVNFTIWQNPGLIMQFGPDTPQYLYRFSNRLDSALILQVPADTTVTYYTHPVVKGEHF